MILFKPDARIKKRFPSIDYNALSLVYSQIFSAYAPFKKDLIVRIKLTSYQDSYFPQQSGRDIKIYLSHYLETNGQFHSDLLHEFRHVIQDKIFNDPWTDDVYGEGSFSQYRYSKCEVDAYDFCKKNLDKVKRFYQRSIKFKNNFKKFGYGI
jgi:uncharacterized protein YozE (UPF0346 family)